LVRFAPPVPRFGFGIAALVMSALTVSMMVVLPAEVEQNSHAVAVRAEAPRAAVDLRSEATLMQCTVSAAFNAPLFPGTRATEPDPQCKQNS
jgi:hypothetical protein